MPGINFYGPINMNGNRINNLSIPLATNDAANKLYVDAVAAGLEIKESVVDMAISNVDITSINSSYVNASLAVGTIPNGVTWDSSLTGARNFPAGTRILLNGQTLKEHNRIWQLTVTPPATVAQWVIATDSSTTIDIPGITPPRKYLTPGGHTFVELTGRGWVYINNSTTNEKWVQFSSPGAYTSGKGINISGANVITAVAKPSDPLTGYVNPITVGDSGIELSGMVPVKNGGTFNDTFVKDVTSAANADSTHYSLKYTESTTTPAVQKIQSQPTKFVKSITLNPGTNPATYWETAQDVNFPSYTLYSKTVQIPLPIATTSSLAMDAHVSVTVKQGDDIVFPEVQVDFTGKKVVLKFYFGYTNPGTTPISFLAIIEA